MAISDGHLLNNPPPSPLLPVELPVGYRSYRTGGGQALCFLQGRWSWAQWFHASYTLCSATPNDLLAKSRAQSLRIIPVFQANASPPLALWNGAAYPKLIPRGWRGVDFIYTLY